jgi:hypothetical protein
MRNDKTRADLQKEIDTLRKEKHDFIEHMKKDHAEIDKLRANQKEPAKTFMIALEGAHGKIVPHEFALSGIGHHDAVFIVEHALANLRQKARLI